MADNLNPQVLDGDQLAIATVPLTGTIVSGVSATDVTALVQTDKGRQLALKTFLTNGISVNVAIVPNRNYYTNKTGKTITVADTTGAAFVSVYKNGVLLEPAQDYTISGTTLTLGTDLENTDKIILDIFHLLDSSAFVSSEDIRTIVKCTQAEYDALVSAGTVDANTLYVIVE